MDCFIYSADIYCEACGKAIRERIKQEGRAPADPSDEYTYDSDHYPKGPLSGSSESDCPQHCGSGPDCLEPTIIGGEAYGKFLENDLTSDGVAYIRDELAQDPDGEVVKFWADYYRPFYYDIDPPSNDEDDGEEIDEVA